MHEYVGVRRGSAPALNGSGVNKKKMEDIDAGVAAKVKVEATTAGPMRVLARMLNDPQHPYPPITQSVSPRTHIYHPLRIHKRHLLLLQPSRACHHSPEPQNPISHEISS
ncbi:hypothetical protein M422DRAFT_31665, partial [Sphaerobolus stellatus SS14]